jgi:hypothetical protein
MNMQYEKNVAHLLDSVPRFGSEDPVQSMIRDIPTILSKIDDRWYLANEHVRGLFGPSCLVDEMALYFNSDHALFSFMACALRRGWITFNQDEDEVTTWPIDSSYSVSYWFMSNEKVDYRLELMRVTDGFSPYHGSLEQYCAASSRAVLIAHASFKVADEQAYAAAGVGLRNCDYEVMQHCESSYGRFSYFTNNEDRSGMPVIKPRINIRDAHNA